MSEVTPAHNLRLLVAYDGTGFRGLAPNDGVRTVVGEIQRVLEPLLGAAPSVVMSGRTDAGVHASGQVLSLLVANGVDPDRIKRVVNSRLGPEVVVHDATIVDHEFSARYSATERRYRYTVVNQPTPDPMLARYAWWVPEPLDIAEMNSAAGHFIGEHDFSSFCRRPKPAGETPVSLVRRVIRAQWRALEHPGVFRFDIDGSAFCHQMVRSLVGLCVAVGGGKRQASDVPAILEARDRSAAAQPAPPHGLNLWYVGYANAGSGETEATR